MKTLLQLIGLRSNCCNASIITWHFDKAYCASCEQWLGHESIGITAQVSSPSVKPSVVQ